MKATEIEKCIDLFGTDIYRFCLKLCMNQGDAEDLYQQTFLKALEIELKLDWEQNPKALFFSLSNHLWKSSGRKKARRFSIAPGCPIDDKIENQICGEENIEEAFLIKEKQEDVNKAIETLPDKIRIPFILYYLFDFSTEQVAEMIQKPQGTVKSRLFKGRDIIKKRLEELGYGK